MALYHLSNASLDAVLETTFQSERILERQNLQALLRSSVEIIAPDAMVLADEFGDWEDSRRRIDLLCLDKQARLVVVELKRTENGGHMELQAIRYAAMVSKMTFSAAVRAHAEFLERLGREDDAETNILSFLEWDERQEEEFASDVRLILASAEFSKELMTSVMWLNEHDVDISCVRLKPYRLDGAIILDVRQIFPLPEAADYQVKIREKERQGRRMRSQNRDLTRFTLTIDDQTLPNLPKLRLAHRIVREAIRRGAAPRQVLSANGAWIAIPGEHDKESFLARGSERDGESSGADVRSFFTDDHDLIVWQGKTYALRSNMWGPNTRSELDRIITNFGLSNVSYKEEV